MRRWFDRGDKCLLAAVLPAALVDLAERRGAPRAALLRGTGLFYDDLHQPGMRVSPDQFLRLVASAQRLTRAPDVGFLLGHRLLGAGGGPVASLLWASSDLRHALMALGRYRLLWQPLVQARLEWSADRLYLRFDTSVGCGDAQPVLMESTLSALTSLLRQQLKTLPGLEYAFAYSRPRHIYQYEEHLGSRLQFDAPATSVAIPRHLLQQPFAEASPLQARVAERQCRAQWAANPWRTGLVEWVMRYQYRQLQALPGLEDAAERLAMSPATFKRYLARHDVSYQQLADRLRKQVAMHWLTTTRCSNESLAARLGYSDVHNFRRSFKRWTGELPSAFRP